MSKEETLTQYLVENQAGFYRWAYGVLKNPDEALDAVQDLVDDALMVGVGSVTILHGKGTGALKEEIRRYLKTVPEVASAVDEHADRGGAGITIVTFS